jgi:hypothetical protein
MSAIKYIIPRHADYWPAVHGVRPYTQADANDVDFWLTDDAQGQQGYFHMELFNLPHFDYLLTKDSFFKREVHDMEAYQRRYQAMKKGDLEYFIGNLYYAEKNGSGNGYDFLSLNDCILDGRTVFDVKNRNELKPYSASLYISEPEPLLPERVVWWLEKLSITFFGKELRFLFNRSDVH